MADADDRLPAGLTKAVEPIDEIELDAAEKKCQKYDGQEFIWCIERQRYEIQLDECSKDIKCDSGYLLIEKNSRCVCK